ncbi:EF-hand domain-containing protein [Salinicola endophyticus]|uniref:EF-hand domain-containing protein n=1 Tax=Salinicola endophyticus TaxID=1949083 RepID=A0AB74U581_9GAMM
MAARRYRTEFVIDGDSRSAVKANDAARESTERLTREMQQAERQSESTSESLLSIGSKATAMAAAVGLSATGIAAMTAQTAAAVREQSNLARAVGVSVQTLQSWSYAGRQVGIDSEKMGDIFKDTADKIGDAFANGGGEAMDALKALNLSAKDLINLSPDKQIQAIGERLVGLPKAQQVTILESIADNASRLIPLFEDNSRLLTEYAQQARKLRIELPQEDIDRLDSAGQSLQYLQEVGRGLAQTVAVELSPAIDHTADTVNGLLDTLGGMEGVVSKGTVALELMASVAAGRALVGLGNLRDRLGDYLNAQKQQTAAQNTAILTERRASAEALRLAQSRQASAKQALANAQATATATGITTNRTKAIRQLAAANGELISAERRHEAAMNASTVSATRYAVAMRGVGTVARGALAMLGGWPGLLIAGATAAVMLSDSSDDLSDSLDGVGESLSLLETPLDTVIAKFGQLSRDQQAAALANWGDKQQEQADKAADALEKIKAQAVEDFGGVSLWGGVDADQQAAYREFIAQLDEAAARGESLTEVMSRNAEALGVPQEKLREWAKLAGIYDTSREKAAAYGDRMDAVAESQRNAADAAHSAVGGLAAVERALGSSGEKWGDYLAKLQASRDTLGMTAAEAAAYAANQAGYTGLYAEQSGAIAGQADALKGYQTALEQGDATEAAVQLARAQRFAEAEAMVQAQLGNLQTLSGLLQGVQSDLSATALSAALVVGEGAGDVNDLVAQALATIEARAAAIRETTNFGSKASDEAKALAKSVKDAQQTYDSLRESFDPLGTAADAYAKKQDALNLLQREGKITAEQAAQAQAELTQQYRESIDPLQGIIDRMDPAAARARAFHDELARVQKAARAAGRSELEITAATAQLAAEYAKADREADPYYQRTLELRQAYDSSALKARQLQQDLADLNARYRAHAIGPQEYQRSVAAVREEMSELARQTSPYADEMAKAWEDAAERIDETFADAFAGGLDSFDDFSGQLIDGFKRLLAELAYQATLKPIVVSFTSSVGNALGIGGIGGGGAGAGGGGLGGLGDLGSLGRNLFDSISSGFGGIQWAGAPTGATAYTQGFGSQVATGGGMFGGSLQNFSGMNGLASMGAGYVGSQLGTSVGSSVFGKQANSNWGATAGGAIGTYFGGPIGSFAGSALGGMLDAAFGSSRKYKAAFQQFAETPDRDYGTGGTPYYSSGYYRDGDLGRGRESAFGSFGFLSKQKFEPSDMIDFLDALQALDNIIASGADADQIDAVTQSMNGFYTSVKNDPLADILSDRMVVIKRALLASSSDVGDALIERVGDITADNAEQLAPRLAQALQLGNLIDGLGGVVQDYAEQVATTSKASLDEIMANIQTSAANYQAVTSATDLLGLHFDALADGAVAASNTLATLAGGIDSLSALQQRYADTYLTDEQRRANALRAVGEQLEAFNRATGESVTDKGGLETLIRSLDLMTESGQKTYVAALQLVGAFEQLDQVTEQINAQFDELAREAQGRVDSAKAAAAQALGQFNDQAYQQQLDLLGLLGRDQAALTLQRQRELASIDESLRPIQERIWALQDEKAAHQDAQKAVTDYQQALASAGDALAGTLGNISRWIDQQNATGGAPAADLQESQAQFARQLVLAQNGDRSALESITQYADQYLNAGQGYYGSGTGYQSIRDDVLDALGSLPDQVSAEEYIADEIKQALLAQTSSLTDDLSAVLRGDNPSSIADRLSGYFDALAGGIDGVLTRDQLKLVMNGKATDAQLVAMVRALDLNGDAVVSGLESVIIRGMPTDSVLANVLMSQLRANGDKALTDDQVRKALSPIATDSEIRRLIAQVDADGNGLLTAQELTNARLGGLSRGIAGALNPMFDRIDTSLDGLIDYGEFGKYFQGLASDTQLKRIFTQLDTDGDGQISALEAIKGATDAVGDNTGSLEQRSLEQLEKLTSLTSEMTRTTDQFVDLNGNMVSLRDAIGALGVAQEEMARIERERAAALQAEQQQVADARAKEAKRAALETQIKQAQSNVTRFDGQVDAWESRTERETGIDVGSARFERLLSIAESRNYLTADYDVFRAKVAKEGDPAFWYAAEIARDLAYRKSYVDKIADLRRELSALDGSHANGLDYVPFDGYRAELHQGEFVATAAEAPAVRAFLDGALPPVVMPPPAASGVDERLAAMMRDNNRLMQQNAELLSRLEQHAAAGVRVSAEGHRRQIAATEQGNRSLERLESDKRLEKARA